MLHFCDPVAESNLYSREEGRTGRAVTKSRANIAENRAKTAEARAVELEAELRQMREE